MNKTRALFAAAVALVAVAWLSCKSNHAPDVPAVPTGPAYCCKDTTYTFKTIVNDPDGDRVAARFDWGDSVVSDWTGLVPSGDTSTLTHAWRDTGTYEISVQARDEEQQRSGWSGAFAVRVVLRRPPNMPHELAGPDRGGQDSSYAFATSASHPDSITVAVRFAWGDGDTSGWSPFVASGESVAMSHIWTAPDTYAVTAQARDTGSGWSLWSLPHSIIIKPPDTLRLWRVQLGPGDLPYMNSSPAIGPDGTIYVGSNDSAVYAVGSEGAVKWRFRTNGNVRSSPSIAPDGTIYVGSNDNGLYAIDPDGVLRWRYSVGGDVTSSPAVAADGVVYVGSDDDYAYAFNPDGTLRWRFETDGNVEASPAIAADGTIYFGSSTAFYALNPDGTSKWILDTRDDVRSSPAVGSDGTVYFGCDSRTIFDFYALNPDSTIKWALSGDRVRSAPAIGTDGSVYFGSTDDYLYALNPDGTLKWRYLTGGNVDAGPAIAADGTIYFGSDDNSLYALHPDGTLKWRYETDGSINSPPTIGADGMVYFISEDGYLYALKGTSPLADSPWPKFHHDSRNTGRVGGGR